VEVTNREAILPHPLEACTRHGIKTLESCSATAVKSRSNMNTHAPPLLETHLIIAGKINCRLDNGKSWTSVPQAH
jgi:hypothetical protein